MAFNSKKALEKGLKGFSVGGPAAAIAAGIVWGFGDVPGVAGSEAIVITILAGLLTGLFEFARNTWKHRADSNAGRATLSLCCLIAGILVLVLLIGPVFAQEQCLVGLNRAVEVYAPETNLDGTLLEDLHSLEVFAVYNGNIDAPTYLTTILTDIAGGAFIISVAFPHPGSVQAFAVAYDTCGKRSPDGELSDPVRIKKAGCGPPSKSKIK